jgi:hypothetical protein
MKFLEYFTEGIGWNTGNTLSDADLLDLYAAEKNICIEHTSVYTDSHTIAQSYNIENFDSLLENRDIDFKQIYINQENDKCIEICHFLGKKYYLFN